MSSKRVIKWEKMRIKEILKRQGWTQKALAEQMGITPSALSQAINGDNTRMSTYERIADALNVPLGALFSSDINESNKEMLSAIRYENHELLRRNELELVKDEVFRKYSVKFVCPHCGKEIPLKIDIEALKNLNNKG